MQLRTQGQGQGQGQGQCIASQDGQKHVESTQVTLFFIILQIIVNQANTPKTKCLY